MTKKIRVTLLIVGVFLVVAIFFGGSIVLSKSNNISYSIRSATTEFDEDPVEEIFIATHIDTPEPLKALYMTSWVGGTSDLRNNLVRLVKETELNSVIIDIKDYSGAISFHVDNDLINQIGATENRIPDIREFIEFLHKNDIYVIGRITVFQDPIYANKYPNQAVQKESDKTVWKDYKKLSFVDVGAKPFWEYIVEISKESYNNGFDELNFDYIRFPSDGNMKDIYYPISEERVITDPEFGKTNAINDFFVYLNKSLRDTDVVTSADLFGMTTTNSDDLNIGQVLERIAPHFDYIAPMVYPSHYPNGFIGIANPATKPYEVVKYSMDKGVMRMKAASTTPLKLRPWLQDFDYGAVYTPELVRAQIEAVYDAGLTSWMLWDASNTYTKEALNPSS